MTGGRSKPRPCIRIQYRNTGIRGAPYLKDDTGRVVGGWVGNPPPYRFSFICQMPQGQMPAQNPQPMHFSSSTTYSYPPPGLSTLDIAPQ